MKSLANTLDRNGDLAKCGILLAVSFLALAWWGVSAYSQEIPAKNKAKEANEQNAYSLESFNIVFENNIFDPNRGSVQPTAPLVEQAPPPAAEPEYLELTGVMIYEDGAVAFFVASDPVYTGACEEGMVIAGFYLMDIRTGGVILSDDEQLIVLPVGARLGKQGDVEWHVEEAPYHFPYRRPMTSLASRSTNTRRSARENQNDRGRNGQVLNNAMLRMLERGGMGDLMRTMIEYDGGAFDEGGEELNLQTFSLEGNSDVNYGFYYQEPER